MALNVMIVDDSPAMRAFIRRVIGLTGMEVQKIYEADDGEAALSLLKEHWIDLVLTDINMPHMNGEELMRQLEGDELLRSIPVIVVSTDASNTRVEKMLALGAKGYLPKPFPPEALRDQMEKLLGISHA
jgi:two-component system chemotaxis response regulator CheY